MKIKINNLLNIYFYIINLLSIYEIRAIFYILYIYIYLMQSHVVACDIQFVRMYGISEDVNASFHSQHIIL